MHMPTAHLGSSLHMGRRRLLTAAFAVALCLLAGSGALAERIVDEAVPDPVLVVHFHHRPPYYVDLGGDLGGTIGTLVRTALRDAGIPYRFELTPPKRQLQIVEENSGYDCIVGWFRTPEREAYARFSAPIYENKPLAAMVRAEDPRLTNIHTLEDLLRADNMTMLTKIGYSYGHELDEMIRAARTRTTETNAANMNMVRMIHAGRADYMFIAPEEAGPLMRAAGISQNEVRLLALPGTPNGNRRYLMFSRMVPEDMVERLNQAIRALRPDL